MLSCQYGTKTLIQLVAQVPIAIITIDVKESKPVNQSLTLSRSTEPALRKQFVPSHPTIQFHFDSSPPRSQHTSLCIYLAPIELHRISLKKQVGVRVELAHSHLSAGESSRPSTKEWIKVIECYQETLGFGIQK